ncbi:hypothetical protein Droror1_Dr00002828 [Drosera rotundifolia]
MWELVVNPDDRYRSRGLRTMAGRWLTDGGYVWGERERAEVGEKKRGEMVALRETRSHHSRCRRAFSGMVGKSWWGMGDLGDSWRKRGERRRGVSCSFYPLWFQAYEGDSGCWWRVVVV